MLKNDLNKGVCILNKSVDHSNKSDRKIPIWKATNSKSNLFSKFKKQFGINYAENPKPKTTLIDPKPPVVKPSKKLTYAQVVHIFIDKKKYSLPINRLQVTVYVQIAYMVYTIQENACIIIGQQRAMMLSSNPLHQRTPRVITQNQQPQVLCHIQMESVLAKTKYMAYIL
jgi:hypothetical protein